MTTLDKGTFKSCQKRSFVHYPLDTERKLNVHKTIKRSLGRLLNILCKFKLRPVSRGFISWKINHSKKNYNSSGVEHTGRETNAFWDKNIGRDLISKQFLKHLTKGICLSAMLNLEKNIQFSTIIQAVQHTVVAKISNFSTTNISLQMVEWVNSF